MITKARITRRAAQDNVHAITVERDYVLAHVVASLAILENDTGLVFKGGTALRLCHIDDYRDSADLDFSLVSGATEDGYKVITRALESTGGSVEGLHLTDDELVLNTERQCLLPRWPDLPEDASVHVYTLLEIAGEKLRCVIHTPPVSRPVRSVPLV